MFNDIISLRQTAKNNWQAKYQGNYGVYTIKITMQEREAVKFSCSCPSDYHPCKHISMIEDAILKQMGMKAKKTETIDFKKLLSTLSKTELTDFVAHEATYNIPLREALLLAFAGKISAPNRYATIIRNALDAQEFDEDDYYNYEYQSLNIEALDQWLDKAREHQKNKQYAEAEAICKACIEEYARWLLHVDANIKDGIDENYIYTPFEILNEMAEGDHINIRDLCAYCFGEVRKEEYAKNSFDDEFHQILTRFSDAADDDFIALQDELLKKAEPASSAAECIIQRKIDFYRQHDQKDEAARLIQENLHFENFRFEHTKQLASKRKFAEAKQLIDAFLSDDRNEYRAERWRELQLSIAQKEKDIPTIKDVAFEFIKRSFDQKYFSIYKATFAKKEWPEAMEKLAAHYQGKSRYFSDSAAQLWIEENLPERLLQYVEKYGDIKELERYYKKFVEQYPAETVRLFREAIEQYVENTLGRTHYEYTAKLLRIMVKIEGGKVVAKEMIQRFKVEYKKRPALMEILGRIKI